ncbi:MAG TPA: hypothetical protein VFD01_19315 [Candidatus Dormibacteraeota bacterium]|nr:hypothetical protein [Candidatus Dormibacteraeota bacterium]
MTIDLTTGAVRPFISSLPTGDHPTEQVLVKDGYLYWSQGSATNSGVVGHDNGGGTHQNDIPCQDVTLSQNVFDSGDGHLTSGYSPHGVARPGAVVPAFSGASHHGVCTGAILRARIDARDPAATIQPVSWGYRNPTRSASLPTIRRSRGTSWLARTVRTSAGLGRWRTRRIGCRWP